MKIDACQPPLTLDQQKALYDAKVITYNALRTPDEFGNQRGVNSDGVLSALLNAGWELISPEGVAVRVAR